MSKIRVGLIEKKTEVHAWLFHCFFGCPLFSGWTEAIQKFGLFNFSLPKGGLLQALEQRRSVDFSDKFNFPLQETFHTFCTSGALCFLRNLIFHGALDVRFLPIYAINYGNFDNALSPNLNLRFSRPGKAEKECGGFGLVLLLKTIASSPAKHSPNSNSRISM